MRVKTKNFKAQRLLYHIRAKEKKRKKHTHTSFSVKLSWMTNRCTLCTLH